jgi:DNA polymerase V
VIGLKKNLSVNGLRIQKELAGDICYPIISSRRKKHSICTSRSLRLEVNEISILKQEIGSHANSCATKLRKQKGCCTKVGVFLGTNPFKQYNKQHYPYKIIRLDVPTNDSMELVSIAVKALESIYRDDFFYKKSGVVVGGIVPQEQMQLSFFDGLDRIRRKRLNKAVDKINSLMGSRKVHLAVETGSKNRKLMQERLSPCYTTRFSDLLEVSI